MAPSFFKKQNGALWNSVLSKANAFFPELSEAANRKQITVTTLFASACEANDCERTQWFFTEPAAQIFTRTVTRSKRFSHRSLRKLLQARYSFVQMTLAGLEPSITTLKGWCPNL